MKKLLQLALTVSTVLLNFNTAHAGRNDNQIVEFILTYEIIASTGKVINQLSSAVGVMGKGYKIASGDTDLLGYYASNGYSCEVVRTESIPAGSEIFLSMAYHCSPSQGFSIGSTSPIQPSSISQNTDTFVGPSPLVNTTVDYSKDL